MVVRVVVVVTAGVMAGMAVVVVIVVFGRVELIQNHVDDLVLAILATCGCRSVGESTWVPLVSIVIQCFVAMAPVRTEAQKVTARNL